MHSSARLSTALVGLGTAALLTGAPTAAYADPGDPTPTPTETATATATPTETAEPTTSPSATTRAPEEEPELYVVLSVAKPTVKPGETVSGTVHVYASEAIAKATKLTVTATGGVTVSPTCTLAAGACSLGDVNATGEVIPVKFTIPASTADGKVQVTTSVSAKDATSKSVVHLLSVVKQQAAPVKTPKPTKTPKPSSTPSGTVVQPPPITNNNATVPNNTTVPPPSSNVPSTSNSSNSPLFPAPGTNSQGQSPQVAPDPNAQQQPLNAGTQNNNNTAIRPVSATEEEMGGIARIQAIWLAILFSVFGVLFVQLRPRQSKGGHRRDTKGQFAR